MTNEFNQERVDKILELGKKAVAEQNNNNLSGFEEFAEMGFNLFPKDVQSIENDDLKTRFWNLGYSFLKMMVKGHFENRNLETGKKWLDRLAVFDSTRHLFDEEIGFYYGKYYYETSNFEEAYKYWREVVRGSGKSHNRYFQGKNPKYWEFYTAQKKYTIKNNFPAAFSLTKSLKSLLGLTRNSLLFSGDWLRRVSFPAFAGMTAGQRLGNRFYPQAVGIAVMKIQSFGLCKSIAIYTNKPMLLFVKR